MGMIFILICAIMTSVSIVSEKENGTMDLLLVSPVRPVTVIIGKLVPYLILSCVILLVMLTTACISRRIHAPYNHALRHDLPYRQHACHPAMAFLHNTCTVVYRSDAQTHDPAT